MRRINIGFDDETFAEIAGRADARQISFAEHVRELVELALESEKQDKAAACAPTRPTGSRAHSSATSTS